MEQRKGSTILFAKPASIDAFAAVGGKKECEGPLGKEFDLCDTDTMFGEMTWERAEVAMQRLAAKKCLEKAAIEAISWIWCLRVICRHNVRPATMHSAI